jgi:hypothetical protein
MVHFSCTVAAHVTSANKAAALRKWVEWLAGVWTQPCALPPTAATASAARTWPPRSQSLMVTPPLVTLRMLKPTVGIMSSWKVPVVSTLTSEVLPAFCSPIRLSSISLWKKRLQQRRQGGGALEG